MSEKENKEQSSENRILLKAKLSQIASLAGVGSATVDRVLNNRSNVKNSTRQRVLQAKAAIESGHINETKPDRPWRIKVILPELAGPSTEYLGKCFQNEGKKGTATVECIFSKKLDPKDLSAKLMACANQGIDAIAFQGLEDPRVHSAVTKLREMNIFSMSLLSRLENPDLTAYIGIDNRTAGRTAGYLMKKFIKSAGKIAVFTGGSLYRLHEDREIGFRALLRQESNDFKIIGVYKGRDDVEGNYKETNELIENNSDLVGIYNVGGGNQGITRALREAGITSQVTYIGHNLTQNTQSYLLDGSMDLVIHLNMRDVARVAVQILIDFLNKQPFSSQILPFEIITKENILGGFLD